MKKTELTRNGPLYVQLAEILEKEFLGGAYRVGDFIPSERAICKTYDVTRITARGALRKLEDRGFLRREHGRGNRLLRLPERRCVIGLIFLKWISPFEDPIYADLLSGMSAAAESAHSDLQVVHIMENDFEQFIRRLDTLRMDCSFVVGSPEIYGDVLGALESRFPTMVIGPSYGLCQTNSLEPDYAGAMEMAIQHLQRGGYQRMILLTDAFGVDNPLQDEINIRTFERVTRQNGYAPGSALIWSCRERRADVPPSLGHPPSRGSFYVDDRLLTLAPLPVGIIATGPTLALLTLNLTLARGLRIPEDVAIVSTVDSLSLAEVSPPIDAVKIFSREVGEMALRHMLQRLESPALPKLTQFAPLRLALRGSCQAGFSMG